MATEPDPPMDGLAARFVDALRQLEGDGDVGPLADLYAADSVAGNVLRVDAFSGPDGAREFWTKYREQFGEIASTFDNVIDADGAIALEWSSTGTMQDREVTYRGVTIIEATDDRITRSCAYFDPTALT